MIVRPELTGLKRLERDIAPPMRYVITIPLALDGRHSMHDGYVIYVAVGAFTDPERDQPQVVQAIAAAVAAHLQTLPPLDVTHPPTPR